MVKCPAGLTKIDIITIHHTDSTNIGKEIHSTLAHKRVRSWLNFERREWKWRQRREKKPRRTKRPNKQIDDRTHQLASSLAVAICVDQTIRQFKTITKSTDASKPSKVETHQLREQHGSSISTWRNSCRSHADQHASANLMQRCWRSAGEQPTLQDQSR